MIAWMAALAHAQGFDAHGLVLAPQDGDPRDPFAVERPADVSARRWYASAFVDYAADPLVRRELAPDDSFDEVVVLDNVVAFNLGLGIAPVDRLRISAAMPVFATYSSAGESQGAALGDVRLSAMVAVANPEGEGFGLGLVPFADLPTGDDAAFLGQSGVTGGAKVAATTTAARLTAGGELGLRFNPALDLENLSGSDELLVGAALGWLVADATGLGAEARVAAPFSASTQPGTATPAEVMATVRHRTDGGGHLGGGIGTALSGGAGAAALRVLVGGGWGTPAELEDRDGDGFADRDDGCPDRAETVNQYVDDDGCPDALGTLVVRAERDGKRVRGVNVTAKEATATTDVTRTLDENPWELTELVPGSKWALTAGHGPCLTGSAEATATEGRTEVVIPIAQKLDASAKVEVVDPDGKPIPNATLRWLPATPSCTPPDTVAESGSWSGKIGVGTHELEGSAPEYSTVRQEVTFTEGKEEVVKLVLQPRKVRVTVKELEITDQVYFELGKAVIKPESYGLLDDVASTMVENPDIARLEIAGHTDNVGNDASNLTLSQKRAEAVKAYLVGKKIAEDRLIAKGYGETVPIATNDTPDGRQKNRRVQFVVLERTPRAVVE